MQVTTFLAINNKATTLDLNNIYFSLEVTLNKKKTGIEEIKVKQE